ncbi:inositol 1,4,5-triphosphate receptor associated 2-like [Leucoraja erinacea]|uniref:inositol 1,4,5-triphosphate receptor associated 2-like n=1 Tax=Leucoraja erinaceus TaxID=7782 RepID=UPI0024585129|nr:inositol 1,4,5-triphosphate receptor associated 2-like [Leucoraja erinacea]
MSCKRHNPVESICRKLQTIRMRDQVSNPSLQIPKFRSRSFDSPQASLKKNMEVILKNRTVKSHGPEQEATIAVPRQTLSPEVRLVTSGQAGREGRTPTAASGGGAASRPPSCCRNRTCSTPLGEVGWGDAVLGHPHSAIINIEHRFLTNADCNGACSPVNSTNVTFCTHLHRPASLAINTPSTDETSVSKPAVPNTMEGTEDASLLCEEDLLDTIFYICDVRQKGKVCVSKIVDYLRCTTSRATDDSGLEELCNMLDPDNNDISIDLATYRAVMKEWIEDCRRKRYRTGGLSETLHCVPAAQKS